jgi:uncharacterized protein CbrC (UPF0167 family)
MEKINLPTFKYHPNPLKTKNAEKKDFNCICCGKNKTIVYTAGIYSLENIEREELCLDCIYDGSAAKKFQATFTYLDIPEAELKMSQHELEEFYERTPGYVSWQDQVWLSHCHSICSFHGDFESLELQQVYNSSENKAYLMEIWDAMKKN